MTYKNRPLSNIVGFGAIGQALRPMVPEDLPVVFFCVKSFDIATALTEQADLWPESVPFVTLCNGFIATEIERAQDALRGRPIRWGMTTMGAAFQSDGSLRAYKDGSMTAWGPYRSPTAVTLELEAESSATPAEVAIISSHAGWTWQDDITPLIRRKWLFNTVLNSLCGALRLSSNGKLIHHRTLADAVFEEAYQLAMELWPYRVVDFEPIEHLRSDFWQLVEKTSDNENSMARDVRLGRRTESAFLAGKAMDFRGYDRLKTYHTDLARLGEKK